MFRLIITYFLCLVVTTAFARGTQLNVDTLKSKDSSIIPSQPVVGDPKAGFKDLFIKSSAQGNFNKVQLNPRAISFVDDYMLQHRKNLEKLKDWGRPYFDMMDIIFLQQGLPKELKYLAVIESHLKSYAISWAGAVGPWQFMPETARRMGLRVNSYIDERTDYYKSTSAAARYLKELFNIYKDWLLVIAAYNGGPGSVNGAIRKTNSRDFWTIQYDLPAESRNHVKKFIATHYIMEGDGSITTLTKDEARDYSKAAVENPAKRNITEEEMKASKTLQLAGRYSSSVIARHIDMPVVEFNRYNPNFDNLISGNTSYELRLPADRMKLFNEKKNVILEESLQSLINNFRTALDVDPPKPAKKAF